MIFYKVTKRCTGTYFAYAFSSKAGQNSLYVFDWTKISFPSIVGSLSSITTSYHFPNRQNCKFT